MSDELTLIVFGDEPNVVPGGPEEDFNQHSRGGIEAMRRFFGTKKVDVRTFEDDLEQLQGQVDSLLAKVKDGSAGGFELSQAQVGLAINGKGTIGLVTAGVEASITLTYTKRPPLR